MDLVLPPACPLCGEVVDADHHFCATCWGQMDWIAPPWCATCHLPFDHDHGETAQCGTCLAEAPAHDGVRAAVAYSAGARGLSLQLKYAGKTGLAESAARAMLRLVPDGADLIAPVPLHRWRIWGRGYNQAALIGRSLSKQSGIPFAPDAIRRVRATPVLRDMGPKARQKAVRGAFKLAPAAAALIRDRSIILVDDVYTSGATTNACVQCLKRAGAVRVTILCWARVIPDAVRGGDPSPRVVTD